MIDLPSVQATLLRVASRFTVTRVIQGFENLVMADSTKRLDESAKNIFVT
jgi:hypothetical protein